MDIVKKRILAKIEEIKDGREPNDQGRLVGLQEALNIIHEVEAQAPREAWGDY